MIQLFGQEHPSLNLSQSTTSSPSIPSGQPPVETGASLETSLYTDPLLCYLVQPLTCALPASAARSTICRYVFGIAMNWFEKWFNEDYLRLYRHRDGAEAARQIAFIAGILPASAFRAVLDVGTGSGRHLLPLARFRAESALEDGVVVGFDLSAVLLREADRFLSTDSADPPTSVRLVRGDMRSLPFRNGTFTLVSSFFTSFGYFSDSENRAVVTELRRVTGPDGSFVLDYLNRDHVLGSLVARSERVLPAHPSDSAFGDVAGTEIVVTELRTYDASSGRLNKVIQLRRGDSLCDYHESVRIYSHAEVDAMLSDAGFEGTDRFGDFDRSPPGSDAPRYIVVARARPV